jgi:hypothetical protein
MIKKLTVLIIIFFSYFFCCKAQLKSGVYISEEKKGLTLTINNDSCVNYRLIYGTTVTFRVNCKIVKMSDSTFQLENAGSVMDSISFKYDKIGNKKNLQIFFFIVRADAYSKDTSSAKVNYEILSYSSSKNKIIKCLYFFYHNRSYCYVLDERATTANVYIDVHNASILRSWKIQEDKLIPFINGKADDKWIVKRIIN